MVESSATAWRGRQRRGARHEQLHRVIRREVTGVIGSVGAGPFSQEPHLQDELGRADGPGDGEQFVSPKNQRPMYVRGAIELVAKPLTEGWVVPPLPQSLAAHLEVAAEGRVAAGETLLQRVFECADVPELRR